MTRFTCSLIGHDWMRNGVWPRNRGRGLRSFTRLATVVSRCGQWELVPDLAETPRKASSGVGTSQ